MGKKKQSDEMYFDIDGDSDDISYDSNDVIPYQLYRQLVVMLVMLCLGFVLLRDVMS